MENYQNIRRNKEEMQRLTEQNEGENLKRKLSQSIEKHFRTTMIGALADMEKEFGVYWGHGKDKVELTDEELEDRERWEKVRNSILDRGNKEARILLNELSEVNLIKKKYEVNFKF